jgi:hypothetical protein
MQAFGLDLAQLARHDSEKEPSDEGNDEFGECPLRVNTRRAIERVP